MEVRGAMPPDRAALEQCLPVFVGVIAQTPPAYSAAKLGGRRAYDLARRGQEVALQPRRVRIDRIDVLSYDYPHLEIEVRCGKGTYIRSLARDLGELLGCGGLIESLRRTQVGLLTEDKALPLSAGAETARTSLLPLGAALSHLVRVVLEDAKLAKFRQGAPVLAEVVVSAKDDDVAVIDNRGELVALGRFDPQSRLLHPKKVIMS
jgi:tRNA pseudouridine55 synthase